MTDLLPEVRVILLLKDRIRELEAALQEIVDVASGERQVADDDTGGMEWVDRCARAALRGKSK